MSDTGVSSTILTSEFSDLYLEIDAQTGAPRRIWAAHAPERALDLECIVTIVSGGDEHHGLVDGGVYPPWGMTYRRTEPISLVGGEQEPRRSEISLTSRTFVVTVGTERPNQWRATWSYEFRATAPRISVSLELHALTEDAVARDVSFRIGLQLPDREAWRVHAPGNMIRPDLPLEQLTDPVAVSPAGGVSGSAGIVAFERTAGPDTLVVWPLSTTEIGSLLLTPEEERAVLDWDTWVAGRPSAGGTLRVRSLYLDLIDEPFASILEEVPASLERLGITSPAAPPFWAARASIYEVQIGFSVFSGDHRYAPYPEAKDLLIDLDRIADLGYDTLQLMPQQPYPSYNVHDYADISTTYGDESVIRQVVDACHQRGMRVILDIGMHGVVDGEVVQAVVDGIESSVYGPRLSEEVGDMTTEDLGESDAAIISWCQHLVNFGPYWIGGSPWRHPLLDEHPEWFYRDSADKVIGAYTRAFDSAHPGWQRYFIDSALALVDRLDVDGFRLDAPSYNTSHNWSARTRANAAVSMLGCLTMFDQLRVELRAVKPDALLYTEPSGLLYRQAMDVNYNYDELWLIRAALDGGAGREQWVRNGRDLGRWFAQRDATLPRGSLTAHHVDSHDTYWWPRPGYKWRREQYGPGATAAMMAVFALSGGPYMTFVGGEVDIEEQVRAVHRLRAERDEFATGRSDYDSVHVDDDDVYAVLRRSATATGLVLVNLKDRATTIRVSLDEGLVDPSGAITPDRLGGADISWHHSAGACEATVTLTPYQAVASPLTHASR